MCDLCMVCEANPGVEIREDSGFMDTGDTLTICKDCLVREIKDFLRLKKIDESYYDSIFVDPFSIIKNDYWFNRNIVDRCRLKIYRNKNK